MRTKLIYALAIAGGLLLLRDLYVILLVFPNEANQGAVYRILFFHVPSWMVCFTSYFAGGVASVLYLVRRKAVYDEVAVSAIEVGVVFTCIGLVTGSIWGRSAWGIWWTWDPRLTWAFITLLVYVGYLMLRHAIGDPTERAKTSSVFCIFAFTSVVITYKAIDWWRTQHPGPVLDFRTGGGNLPPSWETMWKVNLLALAMIAASIMLIRIRQEKVRREIESLRRQAYSL